MRALSVASMIRRAVSAGQYAPGAKLNEVATAERLGVSRNTLREGFALLDADGIIDRVPNRGVFIATPTPESVRDLYRPAKSSNRRPCDGDVTWIRPHWMRWTVPSTRQKPHSSTGTSPL
jgi:DNA-binding FadR family transcriptional regulator